MCIYIYIFNFFLRTYYCRNLLDKIMLSKLFHSKWLGDELGGALGSGKALSRWTAASAVEQQHSIFAVLLEPSSWERHVTS